MKSFLIYIFLVIFVSQFIYSSNISDIISDLKDNYESARAIHFSVSQSECIPLFNDIIDKIESIIDDLEDDGIINDLEKMLLDSHMFIGITYFNAGEEEEAISEFKKIISIDTNYSPDRSLISNTIINAFDNVRKENTALLAINTKPEGATVWLNDEIIGRTPLKDKRFSYGRYDLKIKKPNYEEIVMDLDLNRDIQLNEELNRIYSSIVLTTSPPGIDVYLNDSFIGTTESELFRVDHKYIYQETDIISETFSINEVPEGRVTVTLSGPCYKTVTRNYLIEYIDDFEVETIYMEKNIGSIEFIGDIHGARVYINNELYNIQRNIIENICYGEHLIKIVNPDAGVWTQNIKIDSERRIFAQIEYKPTILWLGLYDRSYNLLRDSSVQEFNSLLERLDNYNILFEDISAHEHFGNIIRGSADDQVKIEDLQALHKDYNYDIIAFGIMDPLSIDREFDIYFYHYSHAKPFIDRLSIKESTYLYNFIINLDKNIIFAENWIGFDLISNSSPEGGLIVINVHSNSPAMGAGIEKYDLIMSVDDNRIETIEDFREYIADLSIDDKILLNIKRTERLMDIEVAVSMIPRDYGYQRNYNYNLILADLIFRLPNEKMEFFKDIYYLNIGLCYMHFGLYQRALNDGFGRINNFSNLGIMYGSPELYSGICSYNLGAVDRARSLFSSAALRSDSVFGDQPYYSVTNIANFYLFLLGIIQ